LTDLPKRILIGRALRSDKLGETLLPKRLALPVFASDPLSSVAYAPGEVLLVLSIAGVSAYHFSPWIAVAVVVLMFTVVASYRQNVHAYPSGGGDYEVATTNLGPKAGLTVASALLVDYVLTVAVSVASGVENLGSAVPFFVEHKVFGAIGMIVLLMLMNLRGVLESGTVFAIPTYAFVLGVFAMIAWGVYRLATGAELHAPTADYTIRAEHSGLAGFALVFLLLRAFSSGCAALTGVEAISNGVPAFRKPKSKNAATTLAAMGLLAVTMFCGIIALALVANVRMAENPATDLLLHGRPIGSGYTQDPVIAQVASAHVPLHERRGGRSGREGLPGPADRHRIPLRAGFRNLLDALALGSGPGPGRVRGRRSRYLRGRLNRSVRILRRTGRRGGLAFRWCAVPAAGRPASPRWLLGDHRVQTGRRAWVRSPDARSSTRRCHRVGAPVVTPSGRGVRPGVRAMWHSRRRARSAYGERRRTAAPERRMRCLRC
jgi:hypothetical protein